MMDNFDINGKEIGSGYVDCTPYEEVKREKTVTFQVVLTLDIHFWAILPAVNINLHSNSFEFEWLCLAIYIDKK